MTPSSTSARSAGLAVAVLTAMNLLNYIDRWVPSAVKDLFKKDLALTDAQTSLPLSAFIIVYMLASPVVGSLAEKGRRPLILAVGVALWSLATAAAGLAQGFFTLLFFRALVGIGEAAYATVAPALISDLYPETRRNRVFTIFYVAIPIGAALGFKLGGWLGQHYGWRTAFFAVGLPGLLVAMSALLLNDPPRGQFDAHKSEPPSWGEALRQLRHNRLFLVAVAGYTANTFAMGGIADWFPTFLQRERGLSIDDAGDVAGVATVVGGLVGTVLGGVLGDALKNRMRQPYLFVCGASMVPAVALAGVSLYLAQGKTAILVALLTTQVFIWMFNAPVNALIVNCVDPGIRARAFGLSLLAIHVLGDVISPPIIGAVSDATGNLPLAIGLVLLALLAAALLWLGGMFWVRPPAPAPLEARSAPSA